MLNILLSCWMIESKTTACAIADFARCGCIYDCSELKGAHVIRVPSLFMVTGWSYLSPRENWQAIQGM